MFDIVLPSESILNGEHRSGLTMREVNSKPSIGKSDKSPRPVSKGRPLIQILFTASNNVANHRLVTASTLAARVMVRSAATV